MISSPTFFSPELSSGLDKLDPDESRHCIRVLRKSQGDRIRIIDGKGLEAEYEILNTNPKACEIRIIESKLHSRSYPTIHIAIAPTKQMERMEWFVEKASEIGVSEISFLETANSERRKVNLDRIYKKSVTALKQSGNLFLPDIHPPKSITSFIKEVQTDQKFIAHLEDEETKHLFAEIEAGKGLSVLIGPEGDFNREEIEACKEAGFKSVSLGDSRLRTETAGIAACHMAILKNL